MRLRVHEARCQRNVFIQYGFLLLKNVEISLSYALMKRKRSLTLVSRATRSHDFHSK